MSAIRLVVSAGTEADLGGSLKKQEAFDGLLELNATQDPLCQTVPEVRSRRGDGVFASGCSSAGG